MKSTMQLPTLDVTRCTGCGLCIVLCPTNCLERDGRIVWLPRPADCVSCTLCVMICPESALKMDEMSDDDEKGSSNTTI